MYKLNLTLAKSIIEKAEASEKLNICNLIMKHRLITNRNIEKYYQEISGNDKIYMDVLLNHIAKEGPYWGKDSVVFQNHSLQFNSIQDELLYCARNDVQGDNILLGENEEFENKDVLGVNIINNSSITQDADNIVLKYTLPYRYELNQNDSSGEFKNWFKKICSNEKVLVFEDPYFFANTLEALKSFYYEWLPLIKKGTKIIICCKTDSGSVFSSAEIREEIKKDMYRHWDFEIYEQSNMHDRHIWCDSWHIDLGFGIAMLRKGQKIRQSTYANLQAKPKNKNINKIDGTKIYPRF